MSEICDFQKHSRHSDKYIAPFPFIKSSGINSCQIDARFMTNRQCTH